MLSALEIFLGYALYKFTFYLLTYLLYKALNYSVTNLNSASLSVIQLQTKMAHPSQQTPIGPMFCRRRETHERWPNVEPMLRVACVARTSDNQPMCAQLLANPFTVLPTFEIKCIYSAVGLLLNKYSMIFQYICVIGTTWHVD